jgi:hypothetical protein
MKTISAIRVKLPADARQGLREELENKDRVPLCYMASDAYEVVRAVWDERVDGTWPPPNDRVVVSILKGGL